MDKIFFERSCQDQAEEGQVEQIVVNKFEVRMLKLVHNHQSTGAATLAWAKAPLHIKIHVKWKQEHQ